MLMEAYQSLIECIKTTGEEVIGYTGKYKKRKQCITVRRAIIKRQRARRRWRKACTNNKNNTWEKWNAYKQTITETHDSYNTVEKMERNIWRRKVMEEGGQNSGTLWKATKEDRSKLNALKTKKGVITDQKQLERETETFFTAMEEKMQDKQEYTQREDHKNLEDMHREKNATHNGKKVSIMEKQITRKEVKKALQKLKPGKSMGLDRIHNSFLKRGGEKLLTTLTTMFNMMRKAGWTPQDWNEEMVTLIHKKGDKKDLDNYRTIAVSSNMGKLFIRIATERLMSLAEEKKWLSEAQAAYRKGRGVEDHRFLINYLMHRARQEKDPLYIGFIDLRKAYDSVDRETLWTKLEELGLDNLSINIIQGLYRNHRRKIRIGKSSTKWMRCNVGLRQGCPLSPILFALHIAMIPTKLAETGKGVEVSDLKLTSLLYADDLILLAPTEKELAALILKLIHCTDQLKLKINFKKSKIMNISPHTNDKAEGGWKIKKNKTDEINHIDTTNSCVYLGITIGRSTGDQPHWKERKKTTERLVNLLKVKASQSWDRLLTGRALWDKAIKVGALKGAAVMHTPKQWIREMEVIQNKVARWLMETSYRASGTGLKREMGWTTIKEDIARQKLTWTAKILQMKDERWPKAVLAEMTQRKKETKWLKETRQYMKEYSITQEDMTQTHYKDIINAKIEEKTESEWEKAKTDDPRLKHMQEGTSRRAAKYLDNTKKSKIFCQARVGDLYKITGEEDPKKCPCCQEDVGCILQHIIKDCCKLTSTRKKIGKISDKVYTKHEDWKCTLLEEDTPEMKNVLGELLLEWNVARKNME